MVQEGKLGGVWITSESKLTLRFDMQIAACVEMAWRAAGACMIEGGRPAGGMMPTQWLPSKGRPLLPYCVRAMWITEGHIKKLKVVQLAYARWALGVPATVGEVAGHAGHDAPRRLQPISLRVVVRALYSRMLVRPVDHGLAMAHVDYS